MAGATNILVIDDEPSILRFVSILLKRKGYNVTAVDNGDNARKLIASKQFDLMLSDIEMRPVDGMTLLKEAREIHPSMPVLMITGYGKTDIALQALRLGAFDYITKPFKNEELLVVVERALANANGDKAGPDNK